MAAANKPRPGNLGNNGRSGPGSTPAAGRSGKQAPTGKSAGARPPAGKPRPVPAAQRGRQSVAAARLDNSTTNNRLQFILGGIAIVVIIGIIVFGFVSNKKNNETPAAGYGTSKSTVAAAADGIVTVTNGTTPPVMLDFYQDGLCPICAAFEQQYGQQINQQLDAGKIGIRYHMLNFLDARSASKNYSTRSAAALLCVATKDGGTKGAFVNYLDTLYASGTQPTENGATDLSDQQLADLAGKSGAAASSGCIIEKAQLAAATAAATTGGDALDKVAADNGTDPGTPAVIRDGKWVNINAKDWLSSMVA